MSTSNIWQSNLPQNYGCLKSYLNLTIWGDLRLRFWSLNGSCCSCDGYLHEV